MRKPRILVTGAAGRTGHVAVMELRRQGFPVRALVRREDARAEALRKAGAEVVIGNILDYGDLERAMADVQRAYHCPPFGPNLLHGMMLFAVAAERAKLEVVAWMSQWNPHPSHPSAFTREHWITNQVVRWMPSVDAIFVNPGLFAYVYFLGLPAIVHFGLLTAPFGEGLNAPPSNEDIGRVASAVLAHPEGRIGKSFRPTGPALISPGDAAASMGRALGRRVVYKQATMHAFSKAAIASGVTPFELASIRRYLEELAGGTFATGAPTGHVEELTGRPADDFDTVARRYFAEPSLIAPGMHTGSKFEAIAFLVRMMFARVPDLDRWEDARDLPRLARPVLAHESPAWRSHAEAQRLYILPDLVSRPKAIVQNARSSAGPGPLHDASS
ncbi:MAG TPA: NmrA family NAD(P)-binding protein [Polyangiaceae bacterium]|nr:NmrA family NAD(P)-binding protein [Polyangiaceae bacterium]